MRQTGTSRYRGAESCSTGIGVFPLTAACVVGQLLATCLSAVRIPHGFPVWQLWENSAISSEISNLTTWLLHTNQGTY